MSDTYTVRRATMDDVKDIHALLMENARKGLLLPRALIFLYGHVRNFLVIDDPGAAWPPVAPWRLSGRIWPKSAPWPCAKICASRAWAARS